MKSTYKYIGMLLLASGAIFTVQAQESVENYLMNDCEDAVLENALITHASEWQKDLMSAAVSGPSEEKMSTQKAYLEGKFIKLQEAARSEDYKWLTPECREKILGTTQEEFVTRELNNFTVKYKQQADRGIDVLREHNLISEDLEMDLLAFPNPANDVVTIAAQLGSEVSYKLTVIDLTGSLANTIVESKGTEVKEQLDVADYPVGVLLIQIVTSDGRIATERLVVE